MLADEQLSSGKRGDDKMVGDLLKTICATLLLAGPGLAPERAAAQAEMVPQATDRGEPSCGFKGVPQITMGSVFFRQTNGAGYKALSTRDQKGWLQLYFHRRPASVANGAVSANATIASAEFKVDFPRRNSMDFKSFAISIDGAPAGIETVGVHNYFGDSLSASLSDDATRIAFFNRLQTARTVTFTTSDAAGKELTRDSYDVSGFANAFRLLDASGFNCNYSPALQRSVVAAATQKIGQILSRQPLEIDYQGIAAPIRAIAAEGCGIRFDLGDKGQLSLPYLGFSIANLQSNGKLGHLVYGNRSEFRIFASGTKENALAPYVKPAGPPPGSLAAMFGMGNQKAPIDPGTAEIGKVAGLLNEVIEMCAPRSG